MKPCEDEAALPACDTFERGPVPFAEFLYRENRRLALEKPRIFELAPKIEPAQSMACGTAERTDESSSVSDTSRTEPTSDRAARVHADAVNNGAIVLNRSRPELVARFMDLYA